MRNILSLLSIYGLIVCAMPQTMAFATAEEGPIVVDESSGVITFTGNSGEAVAYEIDKQQKLQDESHTNWRYTDDGPVPVGFDFDGDGVIDWIDEDQDGLIDTIITPLDRDESGDFSLDEANYILKQIYLQYRGLDKDVNFSKGNIPEDAVEQLQHLGLMTSTFMDTVSRDNPPAHIWDEDLKTKIQEIHWDIHNTLNDWNNREDDPPPQDLPPDQSLAYCPDPEDPTDCYSDPI